MGGFIQKQVAPRHDLGVFLIATLFGALVLVPVILRNKARKHMYVHAAASFWEPKR
jgi:hypothetical protein